MYISRLPSSRDWTAYREYFLELFSCREVLIIVCNTLEAAILCVLTNEGGTDFGCC